MLKTVRIAVLLLAASSLAFVDGTAIAQPKGKGREGAPGQQKPHKQHHKNGKDLLGDKIKQNGRHKFDQHGKNAAYAEVKDGKIAGVKVTHSEKGDVPVKKYKTNKKMAGASTSGIQPVSLILAQGTQYLGTTWIGYSYIDDYGDEVIYWYPYDMIYDGDTGAVEYVPAY